MDGDLLQLSNNPRRIRRDQLQDELGLENLLVVNNLGAVAHAVARSADSHFAHLCGPDVPLPSEGVVTVVGPGTGLGVAQLVRGGADH